MHVIVEHSKHSSSSSPTDRAVCVVRFTAQTAEPDPHAVSGDDWHSFRVTVPAEIPGPRTAVIRTACTCLDGQQHRAQSQVVKTVCQTAMIVCDYKTISETGDHVNFRATLRMTLSTEDEIKLWLKSHTVTWRVDRTDPGKGQKVIFKVDFRCQHKTRPRGIEKVPGRSKNTNCPAKMTVTLLPTLKSTDPHMPTFPTIVTICSDHNHNIYVADALRHRKVGDKTKGTKLFEAGHSPNSALDVLKYDLQVEHGDDYVFATADRAIRTDCSVLSSTATDFTISYSVRSMEVLKE
ncbi:hypothetical protein N1851_010189 [Merluccius polli]|uniref:Uncharacterized protein n=1 Tax=Merluccius polli TaxID=89951 RepID=A0AA47N068_MERPO|nr:hypothetical protein N1851_010189 [Merluccius polli]